MWELRLGKAGRRFYELCMFRVAWLLWVLFGFECDDIEYADIEIASVDLSAYWVRTGDSRVSVYAWVDLLCIWELADVASDLGVLCVASGGVFGWWLEEGEERWRCSVGEQQWWNERVIWISCRLTIWHSLVALGNL
jgi:hypothetical protein